MELIRSLLVILLIEIAVFSVLLTAFRVDFQSTAVLLIFNVLFISLMLQLKGSLLLKLAMLTAGNVIGTVWNYSFHALIVSATDSSIISITNIKIIYTISYPFLNSLWFISFWSFSLTFLRFRSKGGSQ